MTSAVRPAWAKDSLMVRVDRHAPLAALTPEWAFGGATGRGVRVAVVDSGVDADHPVLEGSVDIGDGVDFAVDPSGEVIATHGPHGDVFGHGTACAGIIHVLAPEARITSVRVLGPNLSGKAAAFHAGLVWAVEQGFDVINLSLGTGKKEWALAFHDICDRAYFGNSFVVTAANNVNRPSYPSLFASVASVACNTSADALRFHANPDPPTEFLARGIDVEVPWLDGRTTVTTGNSFAAPHIAAFAALIKSKHPELRPFQLKAALWATSANVRDAAAPEPAGRRATTMFTASRDGSASAAGTRVSRSAASGRGTASTLVRHRNVEPGADDTGGAGAGGTDGRWQLGDPVGWAGDAPLRLATRDGSERLLLVHDLRELLAAAAPAGVVRDPVEGIRTYLRDVPSATGFAIVEGFDDVDPLILLGSQRPRTMTTGRDPIEDAIVLTHSLAVAHAAGARHGDLTPGWLLVDGDGEQRLYGVGLAAALEAIGAVSRGLDHRRLRHRAPERIEGDPPTASSDVYGAAMVICELLTGTLPFVEVDSLGAFVRQRTATDALPITPGLVPARWTEVLQHALHRDPEQRPSASDLLTALTTTSVGGPSDAASHPDVDEPLEPVKPGATRDRWFRRR